MFYRIFIMLMISLFLSGCATTQPTAVNRLQIKVAQLERKVNTQGEDIETLKGEINDLLMGVEGEDAVGYQPFESGEPTEEASAEQTSVPPKTNAIQDTRTIRVTASAEQVQTALKNAGYYEGDIDGKLGSKSLAAIRTFQEEHDLQADGIVGQKTWTALKSYLE